MLKIKILGASAEPAFVVTTRQLGLTWKPAWVLEHCAAESYDEAIALTRNHIERVFLIKKRNT